MTLPRALLGGGVGDATSSCTSAAVTALEATVELSRPVGSVKPGTSPRQLAEPCAPSARARKYVSGRLDVLTIV